MAKSDILHIDDIVMDHHISVRTIESSDFYTVEALIRPVDII